MSEKKLLSSYMKIQMLVPARIRAPYKKRQQQQQQQKNSAYEEGR